MRAAVDGGAAAVEVSVIFDGATLEQCVLWRGGEVEARDPSGAIVVRLGDGGFELVEADDKRVPIGPLTRFTLERGGATMVVAATTPPRRLPARARGAWRRHLGLIAAAAVAVVSGVLMQTAKPAMRTWQPSETVRRRIALLNSTMPGGVEATRVRADLRPPSPATRPPSPATPTEPKPATSARQRRAEAPTPHSATMRETAEATKAPSPPPPSRAQLLDDAKRAIAARLKEAGVVGALAHAHAPLLGNYRVGDAGDFDDTGSIAIASADAQSASDGTTTSGSSNGGGSNGGGDEFGTLDGSEIGDAYGIGGLGLSGVGAGGGGVGDAIGIGDIGTIGRGGGGSTGYGYGHGAGGLGGRRANVPDVLCGISESRGSCDKDMIRKIVRSHINEVRFCYERELQKRPELYGRAVAQFVIGVDGRVTASAIASSTMSPAVDQCLAQSIARWQFVPRCVGAVSYPFTFVRTAP